MWVGNGNVTSRDSWMDIRFNPFVVRSYVTPNHTACPFPLRMYPFEHLHFSARKKCLNFKFPLSVHDAEALADGSSRNSIGADVLCRSICRHLGTYEDDYEHE